MSLALNQRSERRIAVLLSSLPHAVLLTGKPGTGLSTVAKHLAGKDLSGVIEPLSGKGNVDSQTGTISVERIRELYDQTRTKQEGRRVIIIDDADRMSAGAQAAFLKLLEEPSPGTHFILTSHAPQTILPTIRSRVQATPIDPISSAETDEFIEKLGVTDQKTILQLKYLASGLPAELSRLVTDASYFEKRAEVVKDARDFLASSTFEKIRVIHKYQKDRSDALGLLDSAISITNYSIQEKPQRELAAQLELLLSTRDRIEANCSIRLQLLAFVIQ